MDDGESARTGRSRLEAWYERWAFPGPARAASAGPGRPFCAGRPFVCGVNLPWLTYGCDFGRSAWRPAGGVSEPATRAALRGQLGRLAGRGIDLVRWFVLCDGRSGVRVAADGTPAGVDDRVPADIDAALEELDRAGMRAIFVLLDFLLAASPRADTGVQLGGRRNWLADAGGRARLVDLVLRPIVERCGRTAPVAAWDVLNEPEWITRGYAWHGAARRVPRRQMRRFFADAVAMIHASSTFPATVGLASAAGLGLVREADLDLFQVHWYDRVALRWPLETPAAHYGLDRPLLLGEYPTRGSRRTAGDIVDTVRRAGFAGALAWSALSRDPASAE